MMELLLLVLSFYCATLVYFSQTYGCKFSMNLFIFSSLILSIDKQLIDTWQTLLEPKLHSEMCEEDVGNVQGPVCPKLTLENLKNILNIIPLTSNGSHFSFFPLNLLK